MKVLHINQSDIIGGAGIAAYRLHKALQELDVESYILAGMVASKDPKVAPVPRKHRTEYILSKLTDPLGLNYLKYIGSFKITEHDFFKSADILNFHNLHNHYFSYLALPKLTKRKPAVITLHDMWAFTGHCAYSFDCDRWKEGCGKCPYPNTYPAVKRDNTALEYKLKQRVYSRSNLVVVTPSKWLYELAQNSILRYFPIHHIPNGVDTNIFQPLDKEKCRTVLKIPLEKKYVILFGAARAGISRKGGDLLVKALNHLPKALKNETILLTIGHDSENIVSESGMSAINLGYIDSDHLKCIAYSTADLFIHPCRADNLPLTIQESMACGTPSVAFDVGGVSDLVRPKVTGELAELEDTKNLAQKIVNLLEDPKLRLFLEQQCREIAVNEYSLHLQSKRYIKLYKETIEMQVQDVSAENS